jgi:hypothetical protein
MNEESTVMEEVTLTEDIIETSKAPVESPSSKRGRMTREELFAERRMERTDLGSMKMVMDVPEVPGLHFRWVNDEISAGRNRIERLKEIGYWVFDGSDVQIAPPNNVTESNISLGDGATVAVGTDAQGKPLHAILMCIDKKTYMVDQALKEEEILSREEGMLAQGDEEGMYGAVQIGR